MKVYIEMFLDHNLGDDLFLDTLLERYSNHDFYIDLPIGMELNPYFKQYKNLFYIVTKNTKFNKIKKKILEYTFINTIKRAKKYDVYILIGGSLFEVRNYRELRYRYKQFLKYKLQSLLGVPRIVLGANLGPFFSKKGEKIIKKILKTFNGISVRDLKSFNYLKKWNYASNEYTLGSDIIFGNKLLLNIPHVEDKKSLGISIVNSYSDTTYQKQMYTKKIQEIIRVYLSQDKENKVKLLGFDGGIVMSDEEIAKKIYSSLNEEERKRVKIVMYNPKINLYDFLKEFLECEFIVGGRFHSVILSLICKKKFVAINYSEKIENVLLDLQSEKYLISYIEIEKHKAENILNLLKTSEKIVLKEDYKKDSELHFKFLDKILK